MKKALTNNLILKILSVFLAILIWIVVLNIEDPSKTRTISGIKVEVLNEDVITGNNQVYSITEGQVISVKVTGPRTLVDSLKASDFTATADFKDISQADSVPINVQLTEYAYQQKITINETSNNTLRLFVDDIIDKDYEVQVRYLGTAPTGYIVADTVLNHTTVKVTAPESVHEDIKEVCVSVNISENTEDFETVVPVKIYTKNGAELMQADNDVSADIQNITAQNTVYYTKTVPVTYREVRSNIQNVIVTGIKVNKDTLMIMGSKSVLDNVEEIVLPTDDITIDTGQWQIVKEYEVADLLPQDVYLNEATESLTLTISLEEKVQNTISIDVNDIGITNIPDGMDASIVTNGSLNFNIEGMQEDVENLDMNKVLAYVSLKNVSEGISQVAVELQLPDGVTKIGDNYVSVSLTSTESKTTTAGNTESTTQKSTSGQSSETTSGTEPDTDSRQEETTTITENPTVQETT